MTLYFLHFSKFLCVCTKCLKINVSRKYLRFYILFTLGLYGWVLNVQIVVVFFYSKGKEDHN